MRKISISLFALLLFGTLHVWSLDFPTFDVGRFGAFGFDTLQNTSRLTDEQLRDGFERLIESHMARLLDRDRDGTADFTGLPVEEFIERMKIILSDRKPFSYIYRNGAASLTGDLIGTSVQQRFDI